MGVNMGVTQAKGFVAAGVRCALKEKGTDMAVIYSQAPATVAGVFTTNAFKAASVLYNDKIIGKNQTVNAVVVNSGNANACTGIAGDVDVVNTCHALGKLLKINQKDVLMCSTGIIGVKLPMEKIYNGLELAVKNLSPDGGADAAVAIMTTDTYPKTYSKTIDINGVEVTIGGMCKGAGMICPNMATTLCFVTTDAKISQRLLRRALKSGITTSFNSLSVDGDMSTNDTCLVMANGMSGADEILDETPEYDIFSQALDEVLKELAKLIAKDGEGATKYVEINVVNAKSYEDAKSIAMTVANSPLVKTAIFGEDPNWGRVLCAAGRADAIIDTKKTSLYFGDVKIVEKGEPIPMDPEDARKPMLEKELNITIDLGIGDYSATAFTCDFSYEYVKINAEYHT